MSIKIRVEDISFFNHKFLRFPVHPAIEIADKLVSHKNRERPFHPFFLEVLKSKRVIEKCFKPCFVPYYGIHRRYQPHISGVIRRIFVQKMQFGRMDIIKFAADFTGKLRYFIFRFQFLKDRQKISGLITGYMR